MAIIVNNKFPIDTQAAKAVGVNLPFSSPQVFVSNYLTRDAVKNNLTNFFSTDQGERVFNPFFGSSIRKALFENIDFITDEFIKTVITDEMNKYFNFVSLKEVTVLKSNDTNTLTIGITYSVVNYGINDTINITI